MSTESGPRRVVIEGRLTSDGSRSTVVFERGERGWLIHLWGLSKDAVRVSTEDVRRIGEVLSG